MVAALLLAVALAMDAVAVAMVQGAVFRPGWRDTLRIALYFGVFQGVMPIIGWGLAELSLEWIAAVDHWIAFAILAILGARMLIKAGEDEEAVPLSGLTLAGAAVAESIDALAAGVTLPTIGLAVVTTCAIIAVVTTILSALGVAIGARLGERYGRTAEIVGGLILIGLGTKILLEHTIA